MVSFLINDEKCWIGLRQLDLCGKNGKIRGMECGLNHKKAFDCTFSSNRRNN